MKRYTKALQIIRPFLYIMVKEPNSVLNIMHFHVIILFHDLILKQYTYLKNAKRGVSC